MPTYSPNPYLTGGTAGTEVSSTYEGRHVTLLESLLTHPTHTDGLVDKGDPVICGDIVGVAMNSASAATDYIVIDTEGIWNLLTYAVAYDGTSDGAAVAIARGDQLYINTTTAVITKDSNVAINRPFGWALGAVAASPGYDVIAVKVHADVSNHRPQMGGGYIGGAIQIDVSAIGDLGRNDPAWIRGYVTSSSLIEADEELQGLFIRVNNSTAADVGAITGGQFKVIQDATNTSALLQALGAKVNCDLRGAGATWQGGLEVLVEGACTASANRFGIRFISRDTAGTLEALFALETASTFGCATDTLTAPSYALPVNVGGVLHYLQLYST